MHRASTTFFWGQRVINEGDLVPSDDPVVLHAPGLFTSVPSPTVEQATAAPGERRTLTRPLKKGAPRG